MLSGNDTNEIIKLKKKMVFEFKTKDLESLKYFPKMEIARCKEGISMSQKMYTFGLLGETSVLGCRPIYTPIELNAKLKNSGDRVPHEKRNISTR